MENEIVEYLIVNKDLNMSIGKTCAQVAHAQKLIDSKYLDLMVIWDWYGFDVVDGFEDSKVFKDYNEWSRGNQKKIILRAKESKMLKAIEMGAVEVRDNGLTEIPPNSLTVVGFMPQPKANLQEFTKRLQLL